ncbi:unnamed protein product [Cladocopium goreaui]|uniref:Uncharacterized protein n=1 Tax=Cladocopium goreaui TaxID=2562237 RepID=A0A9P1CXM2_9DINO|nr:unnamed protein product [Cladocopium goreaui]
MSWLRGGAQEWNQKFSDTLSRAASSVQRLAEQAELTQLGEHFLASAQNLAEQSEAAWSNVADKVTGGVSSLGLTSEDSPRRSSDLAQQFVKEAKQLESSGTARLMVADVAQVLHLWQERLSASSAPSASRGTSSRPAEPTALKALLQSKAMHLALTSLTRSRAGAGRRWAERRSPEPPRHGIFINKAVMETAVDAWARSGRCQEMQGD